MESNSARLKVGQEVRIIDFGDCEDCEAMTGTVRVRRLTFGRLGLQQVEIIYWSHGHRYTVWVSPNEIEPVEEDEA